MARDKLGELGLTEPIVFKLLMASLRKEEEPIYLVIECAKHTNFSDSSNQLKTQRNVKPEFCNGKIFVNES